MKLNPDKTEFLLIENEWAFRVWAPSLWNSLPLSVRSATTVSTFRRRVKTHLFNLAYLP